MTTPPSPSLTVVLPERATGEVSDNLRELTRLLVTGGHVPGRDGGGGLGGRYGYGVHFENDTFEMHPYYWGDCTCGRTEALDAWFETAQHSNTCYQAVIRQRGFLDYDDPTDLKGRDRWEHNRPIVTQACIEMGLDPESGAYVHCTCRYQRDLEAWADQNPHARPCGDALPNFLHKPTGTVVEFYKYIGRGMRVQISGGSEWADIYANCVASLRTGQR